MNDEKKTIENLKEGFNYPPSVDQDINFNAKKSEKYKQIKKLSELVINDPAIQELCKQVIETVERQADYLRPCPICRSMKRTSNHAPNSITCKPGCAYLIAKDLIHEFKMIEENGLGPEDFQDDITYPP